MGTAEAVSLCQSDSQQIVAIQYNYYYVLMCIRMYVYNV